MPAEDVSSARHGLRHLEEVSDDSISWNTDCSGEVFLDKRTFRTVTVAEKLAVSADCCLLRFTLDNPNQRLGLSVGQHLRLKSTGVTHSGRQESATREYTPVTADHTCGHFDLLVKIYRADMHPMYPEGGKLSQVCTFTLNHLRYQGRNRETVTVRVDRPPIPR